jgi:predicted Zn-dependent protease
MPLTKIISALCLVLFSLQSQAQLQLCVDPLPASLETTAGDKQYGVYYQQYKWTNGSTIRVKFLGGTDYVRNAVMEAVKEWERYANLKFSFVTSGNADIRIAFNSQQGAWSKIGTMALQVPQSQPTMNFGWFNNSTPALEIQRTTLHEFGHAIGLLHEHQNPVSPIKWNYQKAYAYYMQVLGWTKDAVDHNIMNRYSITHSNNDFDAQSIMIYPIPAELTTDGFSVGWNNSLSQKDKQLIADLYPKNTRYEPIGTGAGGNKAEAYFTNINIEHNVFRNGQKGMLIRNSLTILNAVNKKNRLIAYIYWDDDKNMKGTTGNNYVTDKGELATWTELTPGFQNTVYNQQELFFPYEALNIQVGEYKLKMSVHVLNENGKQLAGSGKYSFTYQNGPVCSDFKNISVQISVNNQERRIYFTPTFILKYAMNTDSRIQLYFYHADGSPVRAKDGSTYKTADGSNTLSTWAAIKPGYEETYYNFNPQLPFSIYIPFDEFPLQTGVNNFKFRIAVSNNATWTLYNRCNSDLLPFTLTKD